MEDLNEGLLQQDVVMMGGGNPAAIPAAIEIIERAIDKLQKSGELIRALTNYDGPQGNDAFIESLVHFFQHRYGWKIDRRNIALTNGSQSSFFTLFNSFAGKSWGGQKKILIPLVPEYIGYNDVGVEDSLITSQQAKIQRLENGLFKYQVDFERLEVASNTGLICVSRPTNPSGNVLTDAECQQLDAIARSNGVPLLVDNAYGTPFPSIIFNEVEPFWNDNTIVCMSLSKLGLPGARTGIVIANQEVISLLGNMTAITSLAPGGIGPVIMRQLIEEETLLPLCHDIILPFYQKRAQRAIQLVQDRIDDSRLHIHKPEGALFLWLWMEGLSITSSELYTRLKSKGLLVVPGEYFFPGQPEPTQHAQSCIRLSYAQSDEDLIKGIDILAQELISCWT